VSGVLLVNGNLVDANKNRVPDNGVSMCITEHVSSGAMVQAFRNWAERKPKDWGKEAVLEVMNALHETWPCK
jgi:Rap1a immunity proteins